MAYGDAGQSGGQSGQGGYCGIYVISESAFPEYDYKIEGGKTYIVKGETVREYYKYLDTPDVLVDLYASNNQSYIDSTSKHFVVGSVTAWSTTQTYTFNQPVSAKDITATSAVTWIQGNAGWTVKISATTTSGEIITILERDHGYGQQTTLTNTIDFNPLEQIASITIYAYCYRRSDQYCYGSINIGLTYTQRLIEPATETDYDFYKDVDVYKAIKSYTKGQYYGN